MLGQNGLEKSNTKLFLLQFHSCQVGVRKGGEGGGGGRPTAHNVTTKLHNTEKGNLSNYDQSQVRHTQGPLPEYQVSIK